MCIMFDNGIYENEVQKVPFKLSHPNWHHKKSNLRFREVSNQYHQVNPSGFKVHFT